MAKTKSAESRVIKLFNSLTPEERPRAFEIFKALLGPTRKAARTPKPRKTEAQAQVQAA